MDVLAAYLINQGYHKDGERNVIPLRSVRYIMRYRFSGEYFVVEDTDYSHRPELKEEIRRLVIDCGEYELTVDCAGGAWTIGSRPSGEAYDVFTECLERMFDRIIREITW